MKEQLYCSNVNNGRWRTPASTPLNHCKSVESDGKCIQLAYCKHQRFKDCLLPSEKIVPKKTKVAKLINDLKTFCIVFIPMFLMFWGLGAGFQVSVYAIKGVAFVSLACSFPGWLIFFKMFDSEWGEVPCSF